MPNEHQEFLDALAGAIRAEATLPRFPEALSLDSAYDLQAALIAVLCPGPTAGLKAGVTTAAAQRHLGIEHALLGHLYEHGRLAPGTRLPYHPKRAVECEVAVVVDAHGRPRAAAPALEFVIVDLARRQDLTAPNLVVANLGANGFMLGEQRPWRAACDDVTVRLTRDGRLLTEASVLEALGGPPAALEWIVPEARLRGLAIADGTLILTGNCGAAVPAEPGHYVADYGDFGRVEFSVGD